MAVSKKKVKQEKEPRGNSIVQGGTPEQYYLHHPSWNFSSCDKEKWSLNTAEVHEIFWKEILPHLQGWETQTWREILVNSKKQNHSIEVRKLNKIAVDRLGELYIEAESLISLRLTATHRVYGYLNGAVFNILWIDLEHGDNVMCVCRSYKKHT
ncbi:MAG: hypothetical protein IJP31_04790 [Lachnospiraceae bacterium]|nr:hypothetical protein [Lachnospiraceae bacterium]